MRNMKVEFNIGKKQKGNDQPNAGSNLQLPADALQVVLCVLALNLHIPLLEDDKISVLAHCRIQPRTLRGDSFLENVSCNRDGKNV